jgi:CrcB protein
MAIAMGATSISVMALGANTGGAFRFIWRSPAWNTPLILRPDRLMFCIQNRDALPQNGRGDSLRRNRMDSPPRIGARRADATRRERAALVTYLWVALGGALGSMARFGCSSLVAGWFGETFPWGTLIINVAGSFVIGFFATLSGPDGRLLVPGDVRQFVMVGLCGGYTTFSSFSLQTLALARAGEFARAGWNIGGSVALCLGAVWLGFVAAAAMNSVRGG